MFGVGRIVEGFTDGVALELGLKMWSGKEMEKRFISWRHNGMRKILVVDRKHGHNQRGAERRGRRGGLAEP